MSPEGVTLIEVRDGRLEPRERRADLRRFGAGTVFHPLLTIIGVVYAPAMLVGFTALSLYYLFNQTGAAEA